MSKTTEHPQAMRAVDKDINENKGGMFLSTKAKQDHSVLLTFVGYIVTMKCSLRDRNMSKVTVAMVIKLELV